MPGDDRVAGAEIGILADPARAQHSTIADFEQTTFQVVAHCFLHVRGRPRCASSTDIGSRAIDDANAECAEECVERGHGSMRRRLRLRIDFPV